MKKYKVFFADKTSEIWESPGHSPVPTLAGVVAWLNNMRKTQKVVIDFEMED